MILKYKIYENITTFDKDKFLNDCKPFIKDMKSYFNKKGDFKFLYKGFDKYSEDFLIFKKENYRTPLSTSNEVHKISNSIFYDKFGWYVRDGIFVTKNSNDANNYGIPYLFFPIGSYNYVWSEHVRDFYSDIATDIEEIFIDDNYDDVLYDTLYEEINRAEYTDTDLVYYMDSSIDVEISFDCDRFYLLDMSIKNKILDIIYD